jgi:hypothetical protein
MDAPSAFASRRVATDPLILNVSEKGPDFRTIQAAVNAIMWDFDLRGFPATIRVADGEYEGAQINGLPLGCTARPAIVIEGNGPLNCRIDGFENRGGHVSISGFRISAKKGACIFGHEAGQTIIGAIDFAETDGDHMLASNGHVMKHRSDYTVSGGAGVHAHATMGAVYCNGRRVTLLNRPHFANYFHGLNYARSRWEGAEFIGEATGKRYCVHYNALCGIGGADPDAFFPGDREGTLSDFSTMA